MRLVEFPPNVRVIWIHHDTCICIVPQNLPSYKMTGDLSLRISRCRASVCENSMKHAVICSWLGLPEGCWPPDHYTLLGLSANETDKQRIEHQVHERLSKVRCYQCSHPEQATEAMNRLAQAFICLSDPEARKVYDASRRANGNSAPRGRASKVSDDTATNVRTRIDWKSAAPPVRDSGQFKIPPASAAAEATAAPAAVETTSPPPTEPAASEAPAAPVPAAPPAATASGTYDVLKAIRSLEACRGLATLPKLIDRVDETRQLLWVWEQIGKVLKRRPRPLRHDEEQDLTQRLSEAAELLEHYPKILGHPGQPGYRVAAIAQLNAHAHILLSLDREQRIALAKDWAAGRHILLAYRRFLRREFQTLRRAHWLGRAIRAVRTWVHDHPVLTFLLLLAPAALVCLLVYNEFRW